MQAGGQASEVSTPDLEFRLAFRRISPNKENPPVLGRSLQVLKQSEELEVQGPAPIWKLRMYFCARAGWPRIFWRTPCGDDREGDQWGVLLAALFVSYELTLAGFKDLPQTEK